MDRSGASSYSAAVESAGHALSGLAAFSLLPLFHFQLFFFLLESMGGNSFVLCLAWVIVPSVATRVPRLQVLAARHLREMQAIAGGLLAGSLAAGAAGFLTVRLALSAAGLSVAWGFCQAPHWGRGRGAEVMDGVVAGNHLALVLRLGAGLLFPPSPVVRFIQSLLLPTLLLLGLWFVPPPPLRCWRSSRGRNCSGRGRRFSAGSASWRYLTLFEEGGVAGQQQQQQQQQQTQEHQQAERQQLQTRQRQQTRLQHQQVERQQPSPLGRNCSTASATAATSAAISGGGNGGGGGESGDGGGLELAVARFRRTGREDLEGGVGRQPRPRRLQRREMPTAAASPFPPMATSPLPSPAKVPPTEAVLPGGSGIEAATAAAAAVAAAAAAKATAGEKAAEAAAAAAAAATATDELFSPSSRPSSPPLPLPRRRWQGGDASQPSPGFLESLVASAGFGGLLFLTVLLAGSPWTGDDWAPSPGLGVFLSALRQASVVVAWGLGRAFASTTASASSPAGTAASGTRARVACPSAPETAVLLEGGREGEEMMHAAAVPAAAAGLAGEGSQEETKGERNDPAAAAAVTSVAAAAAVDDNDFDEEGGLLKAAGTGDDSPVHSPVHSPAEITVAAAGSRRRAGLAAALHTCGAEEEEFGRSEASAAAAAVAAAATAGDVRWSVDDDDDAASCLAAAAVLVAGVSAIALRPERPLAVVPGISAVALALPSLWTRLEASCPPGGVGNDGAAVYILLTVWETALVAFEYAPPLRPLRGTRSYLVLAA
ncbi:unnamed protein product, partial [Ectocarpus sp. 4 AP-2014]